MSHDESIITNPEKYPGDFIAATQIAAMRIKKIIKIIIRRKKLNKGAGLIGFGAPAQVNKPVSDFEHYEKIRSIELDLRQQLECIENQQPSNVQFFSIIRYIWCGNKIEEVESKLQFLVTERTRLEKLGVDKKKPISQADLYLTKIVLARMEENYQLAKRAEAEKQKRIEFSRNRHRAPAVVKIINDLPDLPDLPDLEVEVEVPK